jgi:hypothetical protein
MLNSDFDPYELLIHLQKIQHEQAENILKVSEWMMDMSQASLLQETKLDRSLSLIHEMNRQLLFLEQRILLLERHLRNSINNDELKDTRVSLN